MTGLSAADGQRRPLSSQAPRPSWGVCASRPHELRLRGVRRPSSQVGWGTHLPGVAVRAPLAPRPRQPLGRVRASCQLASRQRKELHWQRHSILIIHPTSRRNHGQAGCQGHGAERPSATRVWASRGEGPRGPAWAGEQGGVRHRSQPWNQPQQRLLEFVPLASLWQGFSLKELEIAIGHHLEEAVTGQCELSTRPETNVSPAEGGLWLRLTSTAVTSTGRKLL